MHHHASLLGDFQCSAVSQLMGKMNTYGEGELEKGRRGEGKRERKRREERKGEKRGGKISVAK